MIKIISRVVLGVVVLGLMAGMAGRTMADLVIQSSNFQDVKFVYVTDSSLNGGYGYISAGQDSGGTSSYNDGSVISTATTAGTQTQSTTALTFDLTLSSSLTVSAGASGNQSNNLMESDQFFTVDKTASYITNASLAATLGGTNDPSIQAYASVKISDLTAGTFVYEQTIATNGTVATTGSIPSPFTLVAGDNYEVIGQVQSQGALSSGSFNDTATASFSLTSTDVVATPEPATLVSAGIGGLMFLAYGWRRRKAKSAAG